MNNIGSQFIDLAQYLQVELDKLSANSYEVTTELNNDAEFDGKTKVVVKAVAGNTFQSSAELNYQLDIYTDDIENEINRLTKFVKEHSNTIIDSFVPVSDDKIVNFKIFQKYTTPSAMETDIPNIGVKSYSRLVIFVSLVAMQNVDDIIAVEIDGEFIHTIDRTLTYTTELFSHRISGASINDTEVKTAGVSINFTMINQSPCAFIGAISQIRQGKRSKNHIFNVTLTWTSGLHETYKAKLNQSVVSSSNAKLASNNIILVACCEEE